MEKLKSVLDLSIFIPFSLCCALSRNLISEHCHKHLELRGSETVISQSRWVMGMSTGKNKYNLKVENYVSFGRLSENFILEDTFSDSSEVPTVSSCCNPMNCSLPGSSVHRVLGS